MRGTHWLVAGMLGIVFGGCASIQTPPTPEARQALAPTGKLRVGFFALNPIHAIKDPVSGELKGPAVDLGNELARRIGVPFEAVNAGDVEPVGEGVSELRIDYGPGYRVYFKKHGREVVILLAGGDKRTQSADIKTALRLARNL